MIKALGTILFILSIALGLTISCQHGPKNGHPEPQIEQEFVPFVEEFVSLSGGAINIDHIMNINMRFSDLPSPKVGVCYSNYVLGTRRIEIDRKYWQAISVEERRQLMYHELVHCACNRGHTHKDINYAHWNTPAFDPMQTEKGLYPDWCPKSIMYPEMLDKECTDRHWAEYKKEMFEGCSP